MPTLNIKNEQVYRLARELAEKTGGSMTSVIEQALAEKLASLDQERAVVRAERVARIDHLLDRMAARLNSVEGDDPSAFLYDVETGLPR